MYSWAIPNQEAIDKLVELSPVVEIGAGGGYWAWLVRENGGVIHAYDIEPVPGYGKRGYSGARSDNGNKYVDFDWGTVKKGGPEKVLEHPECKTLFICWPDYGGSAAYESAIRFKGDTIVYIGEWSGGCTGDGKFFKLVGDSDPWFDENEKASLEGIEQQWQIKETIDIPQFYGLHDAMFILERV
jgi:hypothetical protein